MSDEKSLNLQAVPEQATQDDINEWYKLVDEIERFKDEKIKREMELRKKIFGTFFTAPKEGVNEWPMTDGFVMKGTYKLERKVKEELLAAHAQELKDAKLPMKELIELKPSLVTSAYRNLNDEQRTVFDKVLEIKPASPQLVIVKPKRV